MDDSLRGLDLQHNKSIPANMFGKIGYHAVNIEKLVLTGTDIDDDTLIEISESCKKYACLIIQTEIYRHF